MPLNSLCLCKWTLSNLAMFFSHLLGLVPFLRLFLSFWILPCLCPFPPFALFTILFHLHRFSWSMSLSVIYCSCPCICLVLFLCLYILLSFLFLRFLMIIITCPSYYMWYLCLTGPFLILISPFSFFLSLPFSSFFF
jgi:hypothetical protein